MNKFVIRGALVASVALAFCASAVFPTFGAEKKAKNVILLIGDGMGFNCDAMDSYWRTGKASALSFQSFPVKGASATFCVHKHSDGRTDFNIDTDKGYDPEKYWSGAEGINARPHTNCETTDSAASATALNSGQKTVVGRINYSGAEKPIENFADQNYKAGRSVGVVSTNQFAHATPAGASAHNMNRNNYEEISKEQIEDLPITVLMGSGHPGYNNGRPNTKSPDEWNYQYVGGRAIWEKISKNEGYKDWTVIDDRADFIKLASETPDTNAKLPKRLIGLARTTGDIPALDGDADDPDSMVERFTKETVDALPTLREMTLCALNVLAQNKNGFYLMVEGGNIDHANHTNNAANCVLELASFSKAVDAAIEWVEKYSSWDETLMIITADHETGGLWGAGTYDDVNEDGKFKAKDDVFNGFEPVAVSAKGEVPEVQYLTTGHSNALVPVYIKGAGAENYSKFIRGEDKKAGEMWNFSGKYIYNSDIYNIMSTASGVK